MKEIIQYNLEIKIRMEIMKNQKIIKKLLKNYLLRI